MSRYGEKFCEFSPDAGIKREAMYVRHNIEALSCNHCCSGKGTRITYSERLFVALVTQHALGSYRHLWPVPLYYSFFQITS